ncbi:siderophore-interacting protein [Kiloniella sp. b19]|uniref:siderophore-interacting protein n=1 Tax=Kiloniella sp. GXU_MW_B19 TaxID=3141326 RepID=UPI0031DB60C5
MLSSSLTLELPSADEILRQQIPHIEEHGLHAQPLEDGRFLIESEYGLLYLSADQEQMTFALETQREEALEFMRSFLSEYLLEHMPFLAEEHLVWKGHVPDEGTPSNFRVMTVVRREVLHEGMLRLTLSGEGLESFCHGGLHFRLLLPVNPGRPPVWPVRARSGKVRFPEGEEALYNRVYTARFVRPEAGELDFDLVRHAGGVASDWAETVEPGSVVGVMGPGGGGFPDARWLLMGGDETALPAISRILENCAADVCGQVFLATRQADWKVGLKKPSGVEIAWLEDDGVALPKALLSARIPDMEGSYVWFGSEQQQAREVRKVLKSDWQLKTDQYYCAAYWNRQASGEPEL